MDGKIKNLAKRKKHLGGPINDLYENDWNYRPVIV